MANGDGEAKTFRETVSFFAQFLILPLLWLMYQMWTDVGSIKVNIARLEGKLESHQVSSARDENIESQLRAMLAEMQKSGRK